MGGNWAARATQLSSGRSGYINPAPSLPAILLPQPGVRAAVASSQTPTAVSSGNGDLPSLPATTAAATAAAAARAV